MRPPRGPGGRRRSSLTDLREANRLLVLRLLRLHGPLTQPELCRLSGLSRASVFNICRELEDDGAVAMAAVSRNGRRPIEVTLQPDESVVAGIDFGNRHVRVAIADVAHHVIGEERVALARGHVAEESIAQALDMVAGLLTAAGRRMSDVTAVGVGLPGPIVAGTGMLASSSILPAWADVDIASAMRGIVGVPVVVENDANLGALAELLWGHGRQVDDFAYIKVSTGIGAGLVVNGRLCRGTAGTAGEIGHTTIDEHGSICRCGNRGCLETLAAGPALVDKMRHLDGDDALTVEDLIHRALNGDAGSRRLIEDAGRHLGVAAANLCNLLSPSLLIVGGELASAGDLLLDPLREAMSRRAVPVAAKVVRVMTSTLAERTVVLGALALALQESTPSPTVVARELENVTTAAVRVPP